MIEKEALLEFAKQLEGKLLTTKARKKNFSVNVLMDALEFTPESSGKSRKVSNENLFKVIDHYNKAMKPIQPKDYHGTFNSVYLSTMIEAFFKSKQ